MTKQILHRKRRKKIYKNNDDIRVMMMINYNDVLIKSG